MKPADAIKIATNALKRSGISGLRQLVFSYINLCIEPIRMSSLPVMIQIEPTIHCNLQCLMCVNPISDRKRKHMSLDEFKRIVNSLPALRKLSLVGAGEPLMNPWLFDMIEYAKSKGIAIGFATNGMLLTEEMARRVISSGIDWINISIDSPYKEKYEKIRKGANFDTLLNNIRCFAAMQGPKPATELSVWFVMMKDNMEELPELIKLAKTLGVNKVSTQLEHSWSDERIKTRLMDRCAGTFSENVKNILKKARAEAEKLNTDFSYVNIPDESRGRACKWPWKSCYITVEGFVTPCCLQGANPKIINFGNIFTDDFKVIWNNAAYSEFRKALKSDKAPKICAGCTAYFKNIQI